MKAVVFHGIGDIRLETVRDPKLKAADRRADPDHGERDLRHRPALRPRHDARAWSPARSSGTRRSA